MSASPIPKLFQSLQVGDMTLGHRVVMAPMTRLRATKTLAPGPLAPTYYAQRADAPGTLIICESALVSDKAGSYVGVPSINTDEQIAGWKKVVDAVHAKGSFAFLQLGALGRPADPTQLKPGTDVVSASDIGLKGYPTPRSLTVDEIKEFAEAWATAAYNAVHKAGFDGVEIHAANGYLPDQFTQSVSNIRTDVYGGSIPNRSLFVLDTIAAVTRKVGASKTGVRFSPWGHMNEMCMPTSERLAQFSHVIGEIKARYPDFAYVHLVSPRADELEMRAAEEEEDVYLKEMDALREVWAPKPLIIAGGMDRKLGLEIAEGNEGQLVAYARPFLANPDLVKRFKQDLPLNKGDRATYYMPGNWGPEGYTDYPFVDGKVE